MIGILQNERAVFNPLRCNFKKHSEMPNLDNERYIFRLIKQDKDEMFNSFVERLDNQLKKCKFRDTDSQLKDQIIEKCLSNALRKEAFENELSLKQLILTGKTFEAAEKNSRSEPSTSSKTVRNNYRKECNRCGDSNHTYFDKSCPALGVQCKFCKSFDHYSKMCFSIETKRKRTLVGDLRISDQSPRDIKRNKIEVKATNFATGGGIRSQNDTAHFLTLRVFKPMKPFNLFNNAMM